MLVAVTGGTGYVGAWSVRALRDAGHDIRLLVHPSDDLDALVALGVRTEDVEVVTGDIRDPAVVDALLQGCQAVLHLAGVVGTGDEAEHLMREVNTDATIALLDRAVALGLDPVVHVSTYAALFPSPDPVIGPNSPTAPGRSAYGRTKAAADRHARRLQEQGAPVVITYPSSVVGPAAGSRRGVTADGWQPLLRYGVSIDFDGAMMMIDVRDVAAVHAAVLQPGLGPRRYVCGGELLTFQQMVGALADGRGRRVRTVRLPRRAVLALGRVSDAVAGRLRRPSPFSYEAAWLLTSKCPTDDSRTLADLGLRWRSAEQGIREAVRSGQPSNL